MDVSSLKSEIDLWLLEYFNEKGNYNKKIYDAMHYSLDVGGKRIRPLLHCLTYSIYKDDYKNVIPVACAIEMIHTYSLIHDDLPCMDDDDLRRGHATNHKVFGEAVAVLAGDGLLNEAMSIMFHYCMDKKQNEIMACKLISDSAGPEGMIGGQIVDILSEGRKISYDTLCYMHKKKTGALIKASIVSGAILGNAKKSEIEKLADFGEKLGLAFQIKDDILDVIGDKDVLGKNINSDTDNNKTTFITTFGLDECKNKCRILATDCLHILGDLKKDTADLEDMTKFLLHREV
jgi:geranylgeranyl diphosphate synthase type II